MTDLYLFSTLKGTKTVFQPLKITTDIPVTFMWESPPGSGISVPPTPFPIPLNVSSLKLAASRSFIDSKHFKKNKKNRLQIS